MKRKTSVLLVLMLLLCCMFAAPVQAETVLKDGIEATLSTDKESYSSFDEVDAKLTVKNTNSFDVENVSMEIRAPRGFMLTSGAEANVGELSAGEVQQQQTSMRDAQADAPVLPKTGDDSHGMLWGLLFVLSAAVVCAMVIRNPQAKRIVSLMLCVALVAPYALDVAPAFAQEQGATAVIMVSKEVLVNGETVVLTGVVTYQATDEMVEAHTSAFGLKINEESDSVKVREGDTLSFAGVISATEGAMISAVQVFVYDATTDVPYTMGEKYYAVDGLNMAQFDLAAVPEMTIGATFGESDYALTEGGRYAVMFYATDSNGYHFADMDYAVSGNQGPVINVRVMMDPANCDHSAKEYVYERDEYTASRVTDSGDGLTHLVEDSYKRYCADCSAYLMNIWGSGSSQEHTMADGVCTDCGYAAVPMTLNMSRKIPSIQFITPADRSEYDVGESVHVKWKAVEGTDEYVVYVKILDGEPAEDSDDETGELITSKQNWTQTDFQFTLFSNASGKWVKINVHGKTSDGIQTEAASSLYVYYHPESTDPALCGHYSRTARYKSEYYPIENNDEYHELRERRAWYCNNCGTLISEEELDPVQEEHDFYSDGRCSLCRYKIELPCDHTYSNRELLSTDYEKKDDTQHYIVYCYEVTCKDCGILIYGYMPEYRPEEHVFYGTETCAVCGWNKGDECLHSNEEYTQLGKTEYSYDYLNEYEPIYHRAETECVLSCKDCGEVLEEDWSILELTPHRFGSNNQCIDCGYFCEDLIVDNVAPKILSFTSSVGTTVTIGQMPTFEAVVYDENLRCVELVTDDGWTLDSVIDPVSDTVDVSAWSYMGELGTYMYKVIAVDYAGNVAEKELVITVVSDENECLHTEYTDYYNDAYPINYWEKDETSHYYEVGYDRKCNNCSESWVVYSDPPLTDEHAMEEGVCSLCGYTDTTDKVPPAIGVVYITTPPIVLGNNVTYRAEVSDDVELHRYMLYINDSLVDEGPLSGTEDAVEYSTSSLPVGEYYFKIAVYDVSENERIDALSTPITIVGKEEPDCEHIEYTDFDNGQIKYTDNNDGKTHTWQTGYNRICNTCSENMGVVYGVENTADHDYTNGDVCPCGYDRSSCQHTNYTDTYYDDWYMYFEKDEHVHYCVLCFERVCDDCGQLWIGINELNEDEVAPHTFENGVCTACGYEGSVIECLHTEYTDNYNADYPIQYTKKDGTSHYCQYGFDRVCKACQTSWKVYSELSEDAVAPHTFENGVCTACQYTIKAPDLNPIISSVGKEFAAGTEVTFSTAATDDAALSKIELYIDGELKKTENVSGLSGEISYTTSALTIGEHVVRVVATDVIGLYNDVSLTVKVVQADSDSCAHKNTKIVTTDVLVEVDDTQHKTVYTDWTHCIDCDTGISSTNRDGASVPHGSWTAGVCECGYECVHPEKNKDGEENLKDKYLNTVSITDNKDGTTHLHTYNVDRICLTCNEKWKVKIDQVQEEHTIKELDEKGVFDFDWEKHWKNVPIGCSCGYLTGKIIEKLVGEHTASQIKRIPDAISMGKHAHQNINRVEEYCECGWFMGDGPLELLDISGHVDRDGDRVCNVCGERGIEYRVETPYQPGTGNAWNENASPYEGESWSKAWNSIDEEISKDYGRMDLYITPNESMYIFEHFVEAYREDPLMQASVAMTEFVDGIKNIGSDTVNALMGNADEANLWKTFDTDRKTAQIIIDYLNNNVIGEELKAVEDAKPIIQMTISEGESWNEKITIIGDLLSLLADINMNGIDACKEKINLYTENLDNAMKALVDANKATWDTEFVKMISIDKDMDFRSFNGKIDQLVEYVKGMEFIDANSKKTHTFGEMLDINAENVRKITPQISNLAKKAKNGKIVEFEIDPDWGIKLNADFMIEYGSNQDNKSIFTDIRKAQDKVTKEIEELGAEETKKANLEKIGKKVEFLQTLATIAGSAINACDAMYDVCKYDAVLNKQEEKLNNILEKSGCENADAIVTEVMSVLRSTVAEGLVWAGITEYMGTYVGSKANNGLDNMRDKILKEAIQKMAEEIKDKGFDGLSKQLNVVAKRANVYVAIFDIGTDAAMILCNASETKLKTWAVEDIYENFQATKEEMAQAIEDFHSNPSDETYEKMYWTYQYYELMVKSGTEQVCSILRNDQDSNMSKALNAFDMWWNKKGNDQRLQNLKDIEKYPEDDEWTLSNFRKVIFPGNP
ncbi:MAG: hypothetical protein IKU38_09770 [Clostridia bacterium]|nr:hypothetical protein [Clostridia bacterium]